MDLGSFRVETYTGPPFVSIILNWGLFGALSLQVYLYCQVFPDDALLLKFLVYIIYALETAQTFLLTEAVWKWLVSGFGKVLSLDTLGAEVWISVCVVGGIVAFLVQVFYAHRIRKLSKNSYVSTVIVVVSTCSFAGALGTSVNAAQARAFSELLDHKSRAFTVVGLWLGAGVACDVIIALSMCYYLRKGVQGIHFTSTRRLVSRLVRLTLETGSLTASVSIISLVFFYVPTLTLDWEVPMSGTAKLYSTTLLAVLNSRMNLSLASDNTTSWDCEEPNIPLSKSCTTVTDHVQIKIQTKIWGGV